MRNLQLEKHAVGIDTGVVYGGVISGYVAQTKEVVQQEALKVHSEPKGVKETGELVLEEIKKEDGKWWEMLERK